MSKPVSIPDEEAEELSRLLDEIDCRQQPQTNKPEINELLAVAEFIKESKMPVKPPQHIIDQTVDKIMDEAAKHKVKRRHAWLYSGTLSTAAAILLVVGLNLTTIWPTKEQIVNIPSANTLAIQEVAPEQAGAENPPKPGGNFSNNSKETSIPQTAVNNVPVPDTPPVAVTNPTPVNPVPPAVTTKPAPAARSIIKQEHLNTEKLQKPMVMSTEAFMPPPVLLSLPDKKPDSVITDEENGIIRQVYAKGTPQEFIITQQALTLSEHAAKAYSAAAGETNPIKPDDTINKVTTSIYGQQVTIEGRQSKQELLEIVKTLIP
jgi:hypothetical protein